MGINFHLIKLPKGLQNKINFTLFSFFIINVSMLIYFMLFTFQDYFHSDAATKILLANELLQTKQFLSSDWYYVNGDIWILFNHILLIPLIYIFGMSYETYFLNSLLYLVLYLTIMIYFLAPLKLSLSSKLLFLNLSISSLSLCYAISMFGELAYMPQVFFAFLIFGILIRLVEFKYLSLKGTLVVLFILIFIYSVHNPQRTLVYNLIPLLTIFGLLYVKFPQYRSENIRLVIVSLVAFVFGIIIYKVISFELNIIHGASNIMLANYDSMMNNLVLFIKGFLYSFGLVGDQPVKPKSLDGLIRLSSIAFIILLIWSISKSIKHNQSNISFMVIFVYFLVSFLLIGFLYIFTTPLAQDIVTFRYFYHLMVIALILFLFYLDKKSDSIKNLLFIIIGIYALIINYNIYVKQYKKNSRNAAIEISKNLLDNNLTYGFASYWNSYINNVFSKGKVAVYPINLTDNSPFKWLSSERWFNDTTQKKTFILFTNQEFEQFSQSIFEKITPEKVITHGDYKIAIFSSNILLGDQKDSTDTLTKQTQIKEIK